MLSPHRRPEVFRSAALERYGSASTEGRPLQLTPAWMGALFWLLLGASVFAGALLSFGHVREYATGPAVVYMSGRHEVVASQSGCIGTVEVAAGDAVERGAVTIRLADVLAHAKYERARAEHAEHLARGQEEQSDDALHLLAAGRELARVQLEEHVVLAPARGVVTDLRVGVGRCVERGEVLLTITEPEAEAWALVLLPGHHRPALRAGMVVRLAFAGGPVPDLMGSIAAIDEEIIGPAAARERLPAAQADTIDVVGPVVVAHVRLHRSLRAGAPYHGMPGVGDVQLAKERLAVVVFPFLDGVLPASNADESTSW